MSEQIGWSNESKLLKYILKQLQRLTGLIANVGATVVETDPVFTAWDKSTGISITESQISDLTFGIAQDNVVKVSAADAASGEYAKFTANGLEGVESSTVLLETIIIACSDETTDLTIGLAKVTFRMPFAMTLFAGKEGIRASVNTAPVGSTIEVDINEGGSSILSTILSIDASEKTSYTATNEVVISDTTLADDAEITIDIDQIGSSTAGKGLKVTLIGYRS